MPRPQPTGRPSTAEEFVEDIHEIAPLISAAADGNEAAGTVDHDLMAMLRERGYYEILAPEDFGGLDFSPGDAMTVFAELSYVDASVGWLIGVQNSQQKVTQLLEKTAVSELYRDGAPRLAGASAPTMRAERVDGGYRITGRSGYTSGYDHADYLVSGAFVVKGGEQQVDAHGRPESIVFVVEKEHAVRASDWDVIGLRATASVDYEIADVFVPADHAFASQVPMVASWGGASARVGFAAWTLVCHTATEIGLGRRLLDELLAKSTEATSRRSRPAESEVFRENFARAEAKYRSARAWVRELWTAIDADVAAGGTPSREQTTDARNAMLHFNRVNKEIASFVFEEAGGAALRGGPIQRFHRDHLAASQHIQVARRFYQSIAADYLGEAEGMMWSAVGLVPDPLIHDPAEAG